MKTLFFLFFCQEIKTDADDVERRIFFDHHGQERQDVDRQSLPRIDRIKQPHQDRRKETVLMEMEEAGREKSAVKDVDERDEYCKQSPKAVFFGDQHDGYDT